MKEIPKSGAISFQDVLHQLVKKMEDAKKRFEESGGKCANCGEEKAAVTLGKLEPFQYLCVSCNKRVIEARGKLDGFVLGIEPDLDD